MFSYNSSTAWLSITPGLSTSMAMTNTTLSRNNDICLISLLPLFDIVRVILIEAIFLRTIDKGHHGHDDDDEYIPGNTIPIQRNHAAYSYVRESALAARPAPRLFLALQGQEAGLQGRILCIQLLHRLRQH